MASTAHDPQHTPVMTGGPSATGSRINSSPARKPSTTWQGWALLGGTLMALAGLFWALLGLISLFDKQYLQLRHNTLLVTSSYQAWGWVHLIGGLAALAAGAGVVFAGNALARNAAIVVAALSAVVNLGFVSATPVWSTVVIGLDIIVIYALTAHGREIDYS